MARFGGDEFAILQGAMSARAETAALAARIVDAMSAPFDIDGHQVVIGVSIGVAFAPADGTDAVRTPRRRPISPSTGPRPTGAALIASSNRGWTA